MAPTVSYGDPNSSVQILGARGAAVADATDAATAITQLKEATTLLGKINRLARMPKATRLVTLTVTWVCCLNPVQATTAVALRTSSEIIIAADSKLTLGKNFEPSPTPFCKITQIGTVAIAGAGFTELQQTTYDIRRIAARAFSERTTFTDKVDRFERYMVPTMRDALAKRRTLPDELLRDSQIPQERVEVIFATVENGVPMIARRDFMPEVLSDRSIRIGVRGGREWNCPATCNQLVTRYAIGIHPGRFQHTVL